MILFQKGKKYTEYVFRDEEDLENEILSNAQLFFGKDAIYINTKKKLETDFLGGVIPDGFLFDMSEKDSPEFYLVEIELAGHDFYNHIFPQVTKFFAFFRSTKTQDLLVEKIFSLVNNDTVLKRQFKKFLGKKEIYKFLKDTIDNSQNILLIIDENKKELPAIAETYSDTWGKMVKVMILKKFASGSNCVFSQNPEFENLKYADAESVTEIRQTSRVAKGRKTQMGGGYTEDFHLKGVSAIVKRIYKTIKRELLKHNRRLIFNPQKYYVSIVHDKNFAFFTFRKKKIRLVVMLSERSVRRKIRSHTVKTLSKGVQNFFNGPSCAIMIDSDKNLREIIILLKTLVKESRV